MTFPSDRNNALKEIEKRSNYKDLDLEILRMWEVKTEVIPVVFGAPCTIKNQEDNFIRESYNDRDPKDYHAGICKNPQEGA